MIFSLKNAPAMRVLFLLIMLVFLQTAQAQDYCKLIKKEVSPDKTVYEYTSPFDASDQNILRVSRSYTTNTEEPYDNFYLIFQMLCELNEVYIAGTNGDQKEKEEKGFSVEFEDKSKFVDDTIKLVHDLSTDNTQATRFLYFPLSKANLNDFSTKKMVKYSLAGHERVIQPDSANSILHYVQCMKTVR